MKKTTKSIMICAVSVLLLASCGGETIDGAALAQEVCECTTNANALPGDDPNRSAEQDRCSELQKTNWAKVEGDIEQERAFNSKFPCGM
jgi:hypothetical protein